MKIISIKIISKRRRIKCLKTYAYMWIFLLAQKLFYLFTHYLWHCVSPYLFIKSKGYFLKNYKCFKLARFVKTPVIENIFFSCSRKSTSYSISVNSRWKHQKMESKLTHLKHVIKTRERFNEEITAFITKFIAASSKHVYGLVQIKVEMAKDYILNLDWLTHKNARE